MISYNDFFSISQLNALLKNAITNNYPPLKIQGEISNFIYHSSGNCYLTLKDNYSQIRCTLWKNKLQNNQYLHKIVKNLKNGDQINVQGKISFYAVKGDLQFNIENIFVDYTSDKNKQGELSLRLQQLREKLSQEGFFDKSKVQRPHKKNLPNFIEKIAIITSNQAAALQDVLHTLNSRAKFIQTTLFETPVQGSDNLETAHKIVAAIQAADSGKFGDFDAILLCRGGGSIEDLWAFNEEILAKAIFYTKTPIITGIGHETDSTLADEVADFRAVTPTAAAQLISKITENDWRENLENLAKKLSQNLVENLANKQQNLNILQQRIFNKTSINSPNNFIITRNEKLQQIQQRLNFAIMHKHLYPKSKTLELAKNKLLLLNPENILQRGYVYVSDKNQQIQTEISKIKCDDELILHFKDQQKILVKVMLILDDDKKKMLVKVKGKILAKK